MLKERIAKIVEGAILNYYCDVRNVPVLQVGSTEKSMQHAERAADVILKESPGVIGDVLHERARQDAMWGGERHDDGNSIQDWTSYITVYTGQAGKDWRFNGPETALLNFRENMIKVAALAVAAIEWADRQIARKRYEVARETANVRASY